VVVFFRYVRVVALTGKEEYREAFLTALAHNHKVATVHRECDRLRQLAMPAGSNEVLCIKSPTRYVLAQCSHESMKEILRELNHLAEQEDIDFAVVVDSALASGIASLDEVCEVLLERPSDVEKHLATLQTRPEWTTLGSLTRAVRARPDIHNAGTILTFTGIVRGEALALEFDIYERQAESRISSIARDLAAAEGIVDVKIYHKSGRIERGEDIVYIVVAAAHRQEGFKTLREAIERIKNEVPIWKKELTEHGDKWVGVNGGADATVRNKD
jgi:molybdopterin synthase catalytic subunit